jgi:hypothetical protein
MQDVREAGEDRRQKSRIAAEKLMRRYDNESRERTTAVTEAGADRRLARQIYSQEHMQEGQQAFDAREHTLQREADNIKRMADYVHDDNQLTKTIGGQVTIQSMQNACNLNIARAQINSSDGQLRMKLMEQAEDRTTNFLLKSREIGIDSTYKSESLKLQRELELGRQGIDRLSHQLTAEIAQFEQAFKGEDFEYRKLLQQYQEKVDGLNFFLTKTQLFATVAAKRESLDLERLGGVIKLVGYVLNAKHNDQTSLKDIIKHISGMGG